jgi:hypothetical protein
MKVLIVAAGEGVRWQNYRNVPKHIVEVEGQILLHRTYAQFKRYTDNIVIVSTDPRYAIGQTYAPLIGEFFDFGKIYSSYPIWDEERTIIVFGDVYFTDKAVETIMSNEDDFKFFLRKDKSSYTGKKHKEIFALAFNGGMNQRIKSSIETLIERKIGAPGAWRLYLHLHGLDNARSGFYNTDGYVHIDDWTEDFDYPDDLIKWEKMRKIKSRYGDGMLK